MKVLLVDDNQAFLDCMRDCLSEAGHEVHATDSGELGLNAYMQHVEWGKPFEAVFCDWDLGSYDGIDLLAKMHHDATGYRCLVTGEKSTPKLLQVLSDLGADYLQKNLECADEMLARLTRE
jgi:DNA-binding response OmpR family regulator